MTFDLTGQRLSSVQADPSLDLTTDGGWSITVENDYEFLAADGVRLTTLGGEEEKIVAILHAAIGEPLTSFTYTEDGHLSFAVGAGEIRVAPMEKFESWNIVGPEKERVVAMGGGELAIWS